MNWPLRFSTVAARAATLEDKNWRLHHPENADLFDAAYDQALHATSLQPLGYQRVMARQYKAARRYIIRPTGHLVFYRVNEEKRYIIILNIFPGRMQKEPAV